MHLIVDLDDCLVDTSRVKVYRGSQQGRDFAAANIDYLDTRDIHPIWREIAASYAGRREFTVLTDSPAAYAHAVLKKHGFPDVPIVASAEKPHTRAVLPEGLYIGDAVRDVFTAHIKGQPSLGVTWGYSSEAKLGRAQPQSIVTDPEDLEDTIREFESGRKEYVPFQRPACIYLGEQGQVTESVPFLKAGTYIPPRLGRDFWSGDILNFKGMNDLRKRERETGWITYFHNGRLRQAISYGRLMNKMAINLNRLLNGIPDTKLLLPAPNSMPAFGYRSDPNKLLVNLVASRRNDTIAADNRIVRRIFPKKKSKEGGRDPASQFRTLGFFRGAYDACDAFDNVVVFDDVATSGTQLNCIASMLRAGGVEEPIYGVVLGETIHQADIFDF